MEIPERVRIRLLVDCSGPDGLGIEFGAESSRITLWLDRHVNVEYDAGSEFQVHMGPGGRIHLNARSLVVTDDAGVQLYP